MASSQKNGRSRDYSSFAAIDGSHPFKEAVPGGYVDYPARRRHDGEVTYFNFALAKEMGLIAPTHPDQLNAKLRAAILDTFCLVIINEQDRLNPSAIQREDILPGTYMATRYLQLQHPDPRGLTSGDGRSVWNGSVSRNGVTWDISSCGTGVTCLCPATGLEKRFFETGGNAADYGCGTSTEEEGIGAAITSEIFRANGIETEQVLAVIATRDGQAINVRAGRNLLRPAHMFLYARQNDPGSLQSVVDLFIDRQVANGDWPADIETQTATEAQRRARYGFFADAMARTFARISAQFESEYVFCWLDWDGDNILANGGIIDYGSVRQFGMYHRDYRFDDGPRWSTSLPEQRRKARYLVQAFAQIRDYLITGIKPSMKAARRDRVLTLFDAEYASGREELLLHNLGFRPTLIERLRVAAPDTIHGLQKAHAFFERAQARRPAHRTADGLSRDAIFCTRDLLRDLPERYHAVPEPIEAEAFISICVTDYASRRDRALTPHRRRMASAFQRHYLDLVRTGAKLSKLTLSRLLEDLASRSRIINRRDRVTGDALTYATEELVRNRSTLGNRSLQEVIRRYVELQNQNPEADHKPNAGRSPRNPTARQVLDRLMDLQDELRHGL